LHRKSRLFSREFFYLTSVKNALIGRVNGLEIFLFDCPVVVVDRKFAEINGYSTYIFQTNIAHQGARSILTQAATVMLLKTKMDLPRFYIAERLWADKICNPIFMTDNFTILGDDRETLSPLLQPSAQKHYSDIGDLSIEGNGRFILLYYLSGPRVKRGRLLARKDYVFDLIAEAEFLIETFGLGKSFEDKVEEIWGN
jgi:hypothetical protein